ncbi:uncharacterized protein LOC143902654 isoform X4 [Temnothorax americanus]|uniref:uncharacterized protein LOC143902654 isoform X4 n=1 Tax=Temnothorax americanus TaxID=1964332 RepID=UPI0040678DBC
MDILPINFKALRFCGAWKEREDDNMCVGFLRFCYRYAIFFLIYEFTIFDVIEMIRTRDRIQELTEGLFLGLTFLTLCVKYANFLLRENELSDLLECLRVKMCQPKNSTEKLIMEEHSRRDRADVLPIDGQFEEHRRYFFRTKAEYGSLDRGMRQTSFARGHFGKENTSVVHMDDNDLLFLQSAHRVHQYLYSIKGIAREVLFTLGRATYIYFLQKKLLSFDFLSMFLYLNGMLLQLFYYCWYGNELELKSKGIVTAVYSSDWTMVTPQERRLLMLIMISSQRGIMLSYHGVFALSLNTFTWICRTSYSAYNLLQRASN